MQSPRDRAAVLNLPPALSCDPQPLRQLNWRAALRQQLRTTGKGVPPGWQHLDRKSVVPQVGGALAVGLGACIGPKRAAAGAIKAVISFEQADRRTLVQDIIRIGGAAGEAAGDLVGQIQVGQGQGVNSGVGVAWPLAAGRVAGPPSTKPQ